MKRRIKIILEKIKSTPFNEDEPPSIKSWLKQHAFLKNIRNTMSISCKQTPLTITTELENTDVRAQILTAIDLMAEDNITEEIKPKVLALFYRLLDKNNIDQLTKEIEHADPTFNYFFTTIAYHFLKFIELKKKVLKFLFI